MFRKAKRKIAKADEYHVVIVLTELYHSIDKEFRRITKDLAEAEYKEYVKDDEATLEDLFLERILEIPDAVTKYAYDAELLRKRDRAIEAVIASRGVSARNIEMDKAIRLYCQMTGQYQDEVARSAAIQALKDSGVKYVMWRTEEDGLVCAECKALDRKIFHIDKIPTIQHWRCRCRVEKIGAIKSK